MSVTKVAISLPESLLARADAEASTRGETRSAYVRTVLEQALAAADEERTLREARAVYELIERDPESRVTLDDFAAISYETRPAFDEGKPKSRARRAHATPRRAK